MWLAEMASIHVGVPGSSFSNFHQAHTVQAPFPHAPLFPWLGVGTVVVRGHTSG